MKTRPRWVRSDQSEKDGMNLPEGKTGAVEKLTDQWPVVPVADATQRSQLFRKVLGSQGSGHANQGTNHSRRCSQ